MIIVWILLFSSKKVESDAQAIGPIGEFYYYLKVGKVIHWTTFSTYAVKCLSFINAYACQWSWSMCYCSVHMCEIIIALDRISFGIELNPIRKRSQTIFSCLYCVGDLVTLTTIVNNENENEKKELRIEHIQCSIINAIKLFMGSKCASPFSIPSLFFHVSFVRIVIKHGCADRWRPNIILFQFQMNHIFRLPSTKREKR